MQFAILDGVASAAQDLKGLAVEHLPIRSKVERGPVQGDEALGSFGYVDFAVDGEETALPNCD